ncbi:MAG TPA: hypothetical protein VFC75_03825 [Erysipelothrix sp.]|nr:hypothetical protein [Erysipelothrix sp.]
MKKTHTVVIVGFYSATLLALQVALSSLPNVEIVSFLFVIYGLTLGLTTNLMIAFVFSIIEMLTWGFGDWVIGYLWIWPLWTVMIALLKPVVKENTYIWSLINGLWGFLFGMLFAINHGLFYGFNFSIAYWIKGIPFDIIHALSNYIVMLVLFKPILRLFKEHHQK